MQSLSNNHTATQVFRCFTRAIHRLVVIAPHPDDEILGTGRLLCEAKRRGISVAFILLTDGGASHPGSKKWPSPRLGRLRRGEMRRALGRLGIPDAPIRRLRWRDGHVDLDGRPLALRALLRDLGATHIFVTSDEDHHPDHKAACNLALRSIDRRRMRLWTYAVWARTTGNARRMIGRGRADQSFAMQAYRSQITNFIDDDREGFTFPPILLRKILSRPEIFCRKS